MLVFPQMTTGSVALYPLARRRSRRTVVNRMLDGSAVVYADPDWAEKRWELDCVGLSEDEWGSVESLFDAVTGRLGVFTFLEPAGNLLVQSEEFAAAEWDNSALVGVTGGIADPFGGTSAGRVTNSGPTVGDVAQVLAVPGDFRYAVSVWARVSVAGSVALFASTVGGSVERSFELGTVWRRVAMPVGLGLATESVTFGARMGAGVTVDLFGMQVDAQAGVGGYQKTGANGGVHSLARFGSDDLTVRARGTDVFDAVIRIVSKGS
jgi:hypothetical protein